MFTGIVEAVGVISAISANANGKRLQVNYPKLDLTDTKIGDSISVNGVCLTVTEIDRDYFCADLSSSTLAVSTFANLKQGAKVNLEQALCVGDRLGGHLVAGHVDGIATITDISCEQDCHQFTLNAPVHLAKYLAVKGSVTVDGVSLTVGEVQNNSFTLTIVPHTLSQTIFTEYKIGSKVNLEVDLIARYVDVLLQNQAISNKITAAFLQQHGF